jgi:hypothetical protein
MDISHQSRIECCHDSLRQTQEEVNELDALSLWERRSAKMSTTHGGKAKRFVWSYRDDLLVIKTNEGKTHQYTLQEIIAILSVLRTKFEHGWFPLANNVQKMFELEERPGLGSTIYSLRPGDTYHAQGASYLGVVLEEAGILEWNGRMKGIEWRLVVDRLDSKGVQKVLETRGGNKARSEQISLVVQNQPLSRSAPVLTVDDLSRLRRHLIHLLDAVEGVPELNEGLAPRIRRLTRNGLIPRDIAPFMLAVSEARNVAEYQAKRLSPTESDAVTQSWNAILEWAHQKGIAMDI